MKTILKYVRPLSILVLIIFNTNLINAQVEEVYRILITGNTSKGNYDFSLIKKWEKVSQNSNNSAFLMLGNIYNSEKNILKEEIFQGDKYPLLLAPGEKEWANGRFSGKKIIKDIEKKLQKQYDGDTYMPFAACPGPKEVVLNDNLVVILLDTYWWVHIHDRRFNKCGIETNSDVLVQIEDLIRKHYSSKHIVIAGHQTLKSYGNSDGYFSFKQQVSQVPYVMARKIIGTKKDNHHPDFKEFRNAMLILLEKYPDIIYTSAGDANLQYFSLNHVHHIVSGSFEKTRFVKSSLPEFSKSEKGFAYMNFSNKGSCELVFTGSHDELFRKTIYKKIFISKDKQNNNITQFPDSISSKITDRYNRASSNYFWMGENYRDIWNTPIRVSVFNIKTKMGGLHIVKRGGSQQTLSLRLEDKDGKQYVLRSIEKNVEGALPNELNNTFAVNMVQDQISAANPYAALVVAELSEAAGIFHTNPEIVFVPDDYNLGIYRQDVAGRLYLFEEHPNKNRSNVASFGNSEKIISTKKIIKEISNNKDCSFDKEAVLRARLFDIIINDWDRHEDQWKWASFKNKENTIYKPIPRDRDQAFFVNQGLIPWIAKQKILFPKIQGFDEYTENIKGHAFNARFFDRTFLIQSNWKDWQQQIDSLKTLLTSSKIDKAVLCFPKEIQPLCATQTAEILKKRLDNLEVMAQRLYLFLAKDVDITGTNEKDMFIINVPNDTTIQISIYHLKKKNKKGDKIFNRIFYASETKKIRIYGLDDNDIFLIEGSLKNKIDLSIIGGDNHDEISYNGKKTPHFITIYDEKSTSISNNLKRHHTFIYDNYKLKYDRESYEYDIVYPRLFVGYNQDDGIFLGGGPIFNKFSRYKRQKVEMRANYAHLTKAFNFFFAEKTIYPLKHFELGLVVNIKSPNYVNNYFGMGNETVWLVKKSEKEYYQTRMKEYYIKTDFIKYLNKDEKHKVGLSFFYKSIDVEINNDRFISDFSLNNLNINDLKPHSFAGVSMNYKLNTISKHEKKKEEEFGGSNIFQTKGMQVEIEASRFTRLNNVSKSFTKITGLWKYYLSFSQRPRVVYALKVGGEKLFGDYVYNEASKLGQKENLRGFRNTRFYGDASFYVNTEIRIRVKQFRTYVLNGTAGLLLFNDVGRVWFDDQKSSTWHDGYGLGLWWSPFDMALLSLTYAKSIEDNLINFKIKYQL